MNEEFSQKLVQLANRLVGLSDRCKNEESTKLFLVLPFLAFLGYDDRDPNEVCPEFSADFSEKYKNRVDFAILRDGAPIIAVECKAVGGAVRDDRGQLRSYFNAVLTVKMGILTDGLRYEFFADSDEPNMMDQAAFLTLDMREIASGHVDGSVLEGLWGFQKGHFDPDNIGAEAKRKIVFQAMVQNLNALMENPSEAFARLVLGEIGLTNVRTKALAEYRDLLRLALRESLNQKILSRLSIPLSQASEAPSLPAAPIPDSPQLPPQPQVAATDGIVTTEGEMNAFHYIRQRLAFLVKDEAGYLNLNEVTFRDYKGKFIIFFRRERKGRICELVEGGTPRYRFVFPGDLGEFSTDTLGGMDDQLIRAFNRAVSEETGV